MSHDSCHVNWCLAMFGSQPSMMAVDEHGWNEQLGISTKQNFLNIANTDDQFIFWMKNIMTFSVATGKKLDHLSLSPYCLPRIWKCDKVFHPFTRFGKLGIRNSCVELPRNTIDSQIYWLKIIYVVSGILFPFGLSTSWNGQVVHLNAIVHFFEQKTTTTGTGLYNFCPTVALLSDIPPVCIASTWKLRN